MKGELKNLNILKAGLLLFSANIGLLAFSQELEEEYFLAPIPDTIHFYQPKKTFVASIDSLKEQIIDTIEDPLCYLLNTRTTGTGYQCLLAIKTKKGYELFNPFENSAAYASADDIHFERVDFDGKGRPELLLTWDFYAGHSGWTNSVHEREGGMQLWNLEKITRYADFQTFHQFEHWWTNYEENENDSIPFDELKILDSGNEYECERIDFRIEKKKLILSDPYKCDDEEQEQEDDMKQKSSFIYTEYQISKKSLIPNKWP